MQAAENDVLSLTCADTFGICDAVVDTGVSLLAVVVLAAFAQVRSHTHVGAAVEAAPLVRLTLEVIGALLVAAAGRRVPQLRGRAAADFVRWGGETTRVKISEKDRANTRNARNIETPLIFALASGSHPRFRAHPHSVTYDAVTMECRPAVCW